MEYTVVSAIRQNGDFNFSSLRNFLIDAPSRVRLLDPSFSSPVDTRQTLFGGYFQDDWRTFSNLTLNLGLRYEMTTLPTEAQNRYQVLTTFTAPAPVHVKTLWASNPTLKNFQPRAGFSWDPFRNGKTAVRGAFGVFDVLPLPYISTFITSEMFPFAVARTKTGLPAGSFPSGALGLVSSDPTTIGQRYVDQNPPRSYVLNWNVNVQRELSSTVTATVGYTGSRSRHQPFTTDDSNMVLGTPTPAGYVWPVPVGSGLRENPNVGVIRPAFWDGEGWYKGVHAQVQKRMSHAVQAQAAYTYGKCTDRGSGGHIGDPFLNSLTSLIYFNDAGRRGPCDFDIRHNLVLNYVWQLPAMSDSGRAAWFLGGWDLGGVYTASTGTPFTVVMAGDPLGQKSSDPISFPDRLTGTGCDTAVNKGSINYVNLNCFAAPAPLNRFGNAGRNRLNGPGLANFDFSLFKNFHIGAPSGSSLVQFRFEFFNVFNRANFQAPIANSALFDQTGKLLNGAGTIDSLATPSRQIQLGLKVIF
jgi:hypothetical protein